MNKRIGRAFSHLSGIPENTFIGMPVITIVGESEITIELYGKLCEYNDHLIRLISSHTCTLINGESLRITYIDKDFIKIHGIISSVLLE